MTLLGLKLNPLSRNQILYWVSAMPLHYPKSENILLLAPCREEFMNSTEYTIIPLQVNFIFLEVGRFLFINLCNA